jgi:cytosine/adenosine deaminase-related metal-dependent hydrolase
MARAMTDPLVVTGRIVTFDQDRPQIDDGALYIGADELIAAVQPRKDPAPPGFDGARTVRTGGVIYPGLIDLHGHIAYNGLPLWSPPGRTEPYTSRYQWPDDKSYKPMISEPANALGALAGKAHLKYLETKAVVGGTTAIQGTAKTGRPYEGWLVRNIEHETFMTKKKTVYVSALPLRDDSDYEKQAQHLEDKLAFVYHLSEGTDPKLVGEYDKMRDEDCLAQGLAAIHCTALEQPNYDEWAPKGGALVWSPFSNLWLYRDTTDVLAAKAAGVGICLGADWAPSGSKTLLGELKVADMWNRTHLDKQLEAQEICEMATCNPADAINWTDKIGRLKKGLRGDFLVTTDRIEDDPYRNLIESVERDVLLVAINGQPFYGTTKLMLAAGAQRAEPIKVGRLRRSIQLVYPDVPEADMTWTQVLLALAEAMADPLGTYFQLEKQHGNAENEQKPLWLMADKPWDDPLTTRREVKILPQDVHIPPLDSLTHDAAYFRAVAASPLHGGLLDGVRDYYV